MANSRPANLDKWFVRKQRTPGLETEPSEPRAAVQAQDQPGSSTRETIRRPTNVPFPSDANNRRFHPEWYDKYDWLEYSVEKNAAFCYCCRVFSPPGVSKEWSVIGYKAWKTALGDKRKGLEKHNLSAPHITAMVSWREKELRVEKGCSISTLVNADVLEKRRYYVRSIAEIIQFIAVNELPLRGDYDITTHNDRGLFEKLFQFTLRKDQKLADIAKVMPRNATYRSPEIQNEIIDTLADMVMKDVAEDVNSTSTKRYTLLADGARDKNNVENISVGVRFVKEGKCMESLVRMPHTTELDAEALTEVICSTLEYAGIPLDNVITQCYDGASVMSGDKSGVQRRIQEKIGRQVPYVHCYDHRIHLIVISLVSFIQDIGIYFDQVEMLYNFFRKPKVAALYSGTHIKRVLETRWSGHLQATKAIADNFTKIMEALTAIKLNTSMFDGETIATATGLRQTISDFKFRFLMVFLKELLEVMSPINRMLQARETDLIEALNLVSATTGELGDLRSDEHFTTFVASAHKLMEAESDEITGPETSRPKRARLPNGRLDDYVITEAIGNRSASASSQQMSKLKATMYEAVDITLSEFRRRFSDNAWLYQATSAASRKSEDFFHHEKLAPLAALGVTVPSEAELSVCKKFLDRSLPVADSSDSNAVLKKVYEQRTAFPDTYNMLADISTFGSSSALCESTFSTEGRIDKPTRRSMLTSRKSNLVMLAFEKKRTEALNLDEFLSIFAQKQRHLQLF